ncbi:hypothetical protein JCM10908_000210 [Rhodotorula pacifica]|uniref:uncharacterized protein n=1 Tax=Rhodotorula pacifica TaxID=1495444 RepID=UPI00317B7AA1
MSRHRAVKKLDLADELDDGAFDGQEDYYEDMTSEQQVQMAEAFAQVQAVLGTDSPISDSQIRDALWDSYFDVDGSIAHLLDEQHKKEVRKQKEQGEAAYPAAEGSVSHGGDTEMSEGVEATEGEGALGPATESLASLSLSGTSASSATAAGGAATTIPPKNKLAAKMAANKAARAAAAAGAGAESSISNAASASGEAGGPSAVAEAPKPEKKLSKLQQKMLAAKAAKAAAAAAASGTGSSASPMTAGAAVAPSRESASAEKAQKPAVDVVAPPPEVPDALPMVLDGVPSSSSGAGPPPELLLSAAPSAFASALAPPRWHHSSSGPTTTSFVPVASRIAGSAPLMAMPALFGPSPDDKVLEARKGTALGGGGASSEARLAKEARKAAASSQPGSARNSRPSTPGPTASGSSMSIKKVAAGSASSKAAAPPPVAGPVNALRADMEAMGLGAPSSGGSLMQVEQAQKQAQRQREQEDAAMASRADEEAPVLSMAKEKILEEVRAKEKTEKPVLSLVVVGHVDAGKSTLMGRVLHELGETSDKEILNYQRQSDKIGKGSFAYAWTFDAMDEERERGVTIDVAIDSFATPHRRFTLIDAPGHRDFIPNMISGAAQADTAILVVDGSSGGFEKGFEGGGQTREHAVLVRSLGVQQLVVAVNKLDAVRWSQSRFEAIREQLQPFLTQTGFQPAKVAYIPVGAMSGENLVARSNEILQAWYEGPTLVEQLDALDVPARALEAPLRIPVSNVFKGQSATASGLAVSGRIESGIVQVGEKLAALPGDEAGIVRALEVEGELVPYALAGSNATVFLSGIEANQLGVGSVLCPPSQMVPVVSSFTAQVIVFEPKYPITAGYAVELFHHSRDIPATIASLDAILDKATGQVTKAKPRMLTKGCSARVKVQLRNAASGGRSGAIPIEPFSVNKNMGRVLFRRNGETVAAGIVLETLQ